MNTMVNTRTPSSSKRSSKRAYRNVGLQDVAQLAGVSATTVSLAMRDSPRITQETRDKVLQAARELRYYPNLQARNLRTQRSRQIGVLIPEMDNPVFHEQLQGMHDACRSLGYDLPYACTYWDPQAERRAVENFMAQQVDALVVSALASLECTSHIEEFIARGKPICIIGGAPPQLSHASSVDIDRREGTRASVQYLLELGHRHFATLGFRQAPIHLHRLAAINQALQAGGIDPASVCHFPCERDTMASGFEGICSAMKGLGQRSMPTAILAQDDAIAVGVIKGLLNAGLRVPDDVSVVGFDNIQLSAYCNPGLTTITKFPTEIGKRAIRLLLDLIESGQPTPQHVIFKSEIVLRGSTGPPPASPPVPNH